MRLFYPDFVLALCHREVSTQTLRGLLDHRSSPQPGLLAVVSARQLWQVLLVKGPMDQALQLNRRFQEREQATTICR